MAVCCVNCSLFAPVVFVFLQCGDILSTHHDDWPQGDGGPPETPAGFGRFPQCTSSGFIIWSMVSYQQCIIAWSYCDIALICH